jgi:hypothetical protein
MQRMGINQSESLGEDEEEGEKGHGEDVQSCDKALIQL